MITLLFGVYGLVFGSFLNVCILRIPAGESLFRRSHCPSCGHMLRWAELIPVVSWLALRGACRACRVRISPRYVLIELAAGVLWAAAWLTAGGELAHAVLNALFVTTLLGLAVTDAETGIIPLCYNVFIALLGIAATAMSGGAVRHFIGLAAVSLPLLVIYKVSGGTAIGGGDIKLCAAAGLFLGWDSVVLGFALACVLGSAIHIARMRLAGAGRVLRLGPYLAAGFTISAFFGSDLLYFYLDWLRL